MNEKTTDLPDIDVLSQTMDGYASAIEAMVPWPTHVTILLRTPHDKRLDVVISHEPDPRIAAKAILERLYSPETAVQEIPQPGKTSH